MPGVGHATPALLSQGHPAAASSTENAAFPASAAVDGDTGTRWSSAAADPQWLEVDLGGPHTVTQVVLNWEATPLFPVGFGLSYTTFGFSNLTISVQANGSATVKATVTNTGGRTGAEVPQLYIGQPAANGEPPHQLKGYQKITLTPGQSQTVTFTLTPRDLAHWDGSAWTTNTGGYGVFVGDSSRNLPLTGTITVTTAS